MKRLAQVLCAGSFATVVGAVLWAAGDSSTATGNCAGCSNEKVVFVPEPDPDLNQSNWAEFQARGRQMRLGAQARGEQQHLAKMKKWYGTMCYTKDDVETEWAQAICEMIVAADPLAPLARKAEFAWCFDAETDYQCVGYYCQVQSAVKRDNGWEVTLLISPRLMSSRSASVATRHACKEVWQIGADGSAANISCVVADPANRGPDSLVRD